MDNLFDFNIINHYNYINEGIDFNDLDDSDDDINQVLNKGINTTLTKYNLQKVPILNVLFSEYNIQKPTGYSLEKDQKTGYDILVLRRSTYSSYAENFKSILMNNNFIRIDTISDDYMDIMHGKVDITEYILSIPYVQMLINRKEWSDDKLENQKNGILRDIAKFKNTFYKLDEDVQNLMYSQLSELSRFYISPDNGLIYKEYHYRFKTDKPYLSIFTYTGLKYYDIRNTYNKDKHDTMEKVKKESTRKYRVLNKCIRNNKFTDVLQTPWRDRYVWVPDYSNNSPVYRKYINWNEEFVTRRKYNICKHMNKEPRRDLWYEVDLKNSHIDTNADIRFETMDGTIYLDIYNLKNHQDLLPLIRRKAMFSDDIKEKNSILKQNWSQTIPTMPTGMFEVGLTEDGQKLLK